MPPDRDNSVLIASAIIFAALAIVAGMFYLRYAG
jgi:hypothetical protein